ncbi:sugar ABC transporter substrate-binding protein [Clostridia bacterium]|nr:sugar ABC transporter substrate-binding protein [Clostridia bacterium]
MKIKKILAGILTAALFTSCAPSGGTTTTTTRTTPSAGGKIQVGVVLPEKDLPRWIQDEANFKKALDAKGITYDIKFSQGSSDTEKGNVESLVASGIKVLLICPTDGLAAASTINYAKENGVSTISYDRPIMTTDGLDYIVGFDSDDVGVAQANYLISKAEGTGNPLYLYTGPSSDENAFLFFGGAWKTLQPKIADGTFVIQNSSEAQAVSSINELSHEEMAKIVGQVATNWDANLAKSKAEANLQDPNAPKGTVFILAPNDTVSRAIGDVFAPAVEKYYITGQDAEKASIQYIIDGKQSMTVLKDLRELSAKAVDVADAILKGNPVETTSVTDTGASKEIPTIQLKVITITQDNVQQDIFDSGYYDAADFTLK